MITNERQYRITKSQLNHLKQAVANFDLEEKTQQAGSEILAVAELEALKSEVGVLEIRYKNMKT